MRAVDTNVIVIHEAKTRLSQLLEEAQRGEPLIIAKAGRPVARLTRIDAPGPDAQSRLGLLRGEVVVPDDFDRMGAGEIEALFGGDDASSA